MMAPTEMSKLPEMMRMVAPAATSPSTEDCSRMLMRLRGLKKRSLMRPVKMPRPIVSSRMSTHWLAATKERTALRRVRSLAGPGTAGLLVGDDSVACDTQELLHQTLLRGFGGRDRGDDAALAHDGDAVADREQLGQV